MGAWNIQCRDSGCGMETDPGNLADLVNPANGHIDNRGWFVCKWCRTRGQIKKSLKTTEGPYTGYLKAVIRLSGYEKRIYQPFAFLVGDAADEQPTEVWPRYYNLIPDEDQGTRLNVGRNAPIFKTEDVLELMVQLVKIGIWNEDQIIEAIQNEQRSLLP